MNDSANNFNNQTGLPDENLSGLGDQPVGSGLPEPPEPQSLIQKFGVTRVVSTVLGMLLMIGGVGAGVVLVMQPQLIEQKALTITYDTCGTGYTCQTLDYYPCSASGGKVQSCTKLGGAVGNCCTRVAPTPTPTPTPVPCSPTGKCTVGVCKSGFCVPTTTLTPISGCGASNGMVYVSQKDSRWKDDPIQGGACDFEYIGCGPSVMTAIIATKQGSCYNPWETSQKAIPNFTCNGVGAHGAAQLLNNMGVSTTRVADSSDPTVMKQNVVNAFLASGGKPVMVGVKIKEPNGSIVSHVTLMVGYNPQTGNPIFNDPLFGANNELEANGYTVKWGTADADKVN